MAPIVNLLCRDESIECLVGVTAQHREMLDQVLDLFEIEPVFDLNLMRAGQELTDICSQILGGLGVKLREIGPDMVLVHGDTATTAMAALAAFFTAIPVAHVEAGLRTYDLQAPYPEEFNRQLTTKVAALHLAPTEQSKSNLVEEGVCPSTIEVTGNTVIDALYMTLDVIRQDLIKENEMVDVLASRLGFDVRNRKYVLITGHRREAFGSSFEEICYAISDLASMFVDVFFVYPVHFNPNVRGPVNKILREKPNVVLLDPLDYGPFCYLLSNCKLVLTDSGGIQEEAPSLGKPVLVMRDTTERPEGVLSGTVRLVGTKKEKIIAEVSELLTDTHAYERMAQAVNPYGDGQSAERVVKFIKARMGVGDGGEI